MPNDNDPEYITVLLNTPTAESYWSFLVSDSKTGERVSSDTMRNNSTILNKTTHQVIPHFKGLYRRKIIPSDI